MLYLHFSSVWGSVCFPARSSWSGILFPACQSNHFAAPAAYGDLLTAGLALLAAFMLRLRPGLALPFVWLFNLVGIIDLLYALYEGAMIGLPDFHLGVAWFIPTFYVPLLLVSHVIVFWFLLRAAPSTQGSSVERGEILLRQGRCDYASPSINRTLTKVGRSRDRRMRGPDIFSRRFSR